MSSNEGQKFESEVAKMRLKVFNVNYLKKVLSFSNYVALIDYLLVIIIVVKKIIKKLKI